MVGELGNVLEKVLIDVGKLFQFVIEFDDINVFDVTDGNCRRGGIKLCNIVGLRLLYEKK